MPVGRRSDWDELVQTILARCRAEGMSEQVLSELKHELVSQGVYQSWQRDEKFRAFADELRTRQGTVAPDFDALYRHKAELDNDPRH